MPQLEEFYKHASETISRLRFEHKDNTQFVRLTELYASFNKKDQEGLAVLRQELALALRMAQLPMTTCQHFFSHQILPIQRREDAIAAQEISMAVQARRNGDPLPDDVSEKLSSGKWTDQQR